MGNSLKTFWRFGYENVNRPTSQIDCHNNYWMHVFGPFYYMVKRGGKW